MSSQQTKSIFVNVGTFVFLLLSWLFFGSFVSLTATNMAGDFFEDGVAFLGGFQFNNLLPLIGTAIFGLGWLVGFLIARSTWSFIKQLVVSILFVVMIIGFTYIMVSWSVVNSFPVFRELVQVCTLLCMFGFIAGNPIGVLQKMKMS